MVIAYAVRRRGLPGQKGATVSTSYIHVERDEMDSSGDEGEVGHATTGRHATAGRHATTGRHVTTGRCGRGQPACTSSPPASADTLCTPHYCAVSHTHTHTHTPHTGAPGVADAECRQPLCRVQRQPSLGGKVQGGVLQSRLVGVILASLVQAFLHNATTASISWGRHKQCIRNGSTHRFPPLTIGSQLALGSDPMPVNPMLWPEVS